MTNPTPTASMNAYLRNLFAYPANAITGEANRQALVDMGMIVVGEADTLTEAGNGYLKALLAEEAEARVSRNKVSAKGRAAAKRSQFVFRKA